MRKENAKSSADPVDPEQESGESFLGRWSRRKRHARTHPEHKESAESPVTEQFDAGITEESEPERVLTDEDMPPLESLDQDSDYSGFLSPGVSDALRNAALKRMFLSPKYNIVDGLDDYADDFTKFEPLGDIITADMRHQMELAEERAKKALEEEVAASDEKTANTDTAANADHAGRDHDDPSADSASVEAKGDDADGTDMADAPGDGARSG